MFCRMSKRTNATYWYAVLVSERGAVLIDVWYARGMLGKEPKQVAVLHNSGNLAGTAGV